MTRNGRSVIQGYFPHGVAQLAARLSARAAVQQPKCSIRNCAQAKLPHHAPMHALVAAPIQRHASGQANAFALPEQLASFTEVGGQPLPPNVRQKMESFFGASFSDVRVHVGPQASQIGALAFTQGSHIHFAPGQYNPTSAQGQQILGHELAHVVQQRAGRVRNPFGSGVAVVQDRHLESEADVMGARAAAHSPDTGRR
ncbi:MAG TPA: DUF4157 domain-containing protein [Thermoanaerobaculia bacterium]|nr:DUF4157 domain-containing protein [Thermoanaerobaculia bacterium]